MLRSSERLSGAARMAPGATYFPEPYPGERAAPAPARHCDLQQEKVGCAAGDSSDFCAQVMEEVSSAR